MPYLNHMNPKVIHALLSDSSGSVLLVRRRGALLLGLPGGDVRGAAQLHDLLATLCARQVGVAPDFAGPMTLFSLAGNQVALGFSEIAHSRAGARGRVEAAFWIRPDKLPMEVDPVARYAVAMYLQRAVRRPGVLPTAVLPGIPA